MIYGIYKKKIYKNKISLSPLINLSDIAKSLFIRRINGDFKNYQSLYKSRNCIVYPRSTLSFYNVFLFLKKTYKKNVVFIPDYICNESLSLLRKTNADIIFYDHTLINKKKLITDLKNKKGNILLIVNYFGKFNKLGSNIINFIRENNITLIEDNTHCIVSSENQLADIEIFSPHKLFGIEDGSIIKFKEEFSYLKFEKFHLKNIKIYKDNKFKRFFDLIIYFFKKKIRSIIGYKYTKLNFNIAPKTKYKINNSIGLVSINLLNLYTKRIKNYSLQRIDNYNTWRNNLKFILPFIEMQKIKYIPYLGIIKFSNSKLRTRILNQYVSYGLPIGNWPDLPPEVMKGKNKYNRAISKFQNQVTIPVHQDLNSLQIINCINKVFEQYINSFEISYNQNNNEIKIIQNNKIIGKIKILYNHLTKNNFLFLIIDEKFYIAYNKSLDFFNKFSRGIIKNLEKKNKFTLPNNIIFYQQSCSKKNIIPLNISNKKILDFIYIFFEIICEKEIENFKTINYKILNKKSKNEFEIISGNNNASIISKFFLEKKEKHIYLKDIEIFNDEYQLSSQIYSFCIFLKNKGYLNIKIKSNLKNIQKSY